jgi:uncharacterized protein YqgV (UPF0045/DUF77 family)
MQLSAQVSLYPLGQPDLSPAIQAVWQALDSNGLRYQPGPMSTVLEGEGEAVFSALQDAFRAASECGGTVMVVTLSNVCPRLSQTEKATP